MVAPSALLAVVVGRGIQAGGAKAEIPSDHRIREMLRVDDDLGGEYGALVGFGSRAFPAYLRILDAKDSSAYEVTRLFSVLVAVKGDRSHFLEHAVSKLAHPHPNVRRTAVQLLAQIGSERDAAPVVALLSDREWTNSVAAAKTLAATGDRRALAAMDVWLSSSNPVKDRSERFNEVHRQDIAKYRDQLKERLDKAKKPEK